MTQSAGHILCFVCTISKNSNYRTVSNTSLYYKNNPNYNRTTLKYIVVKDQGYEEMKTRKLKD